MFHGWSYSGKQNKWDIIIGIIKGSFVGKLPGYGRRSWLACTPSSCQTHHDVNPIIMSTTWSCQPHHQVVGKRKRAEACEFTGQNRLGHETLVFTGIYETVARARFALQNVKKLGRWEHFGRGRKNVHETVARARSHKRVVKNWGLQSTFGRWGCTQDCHESSISQQQKKTDGIGAWLTVSLIHWFIHWFTASLVHWFTDSFWFTDSSIQWLIASLICWFIESFDSLIRRFICSMVHCMIHWLIDWFFAAFIDWFIDFLFHGFICSLVHWLFASVIHWFIASLVHWFIGSLVHSFTGSLVHWLMDSLVHCLIDH